MYPYNLTLLLYPNKNWDTLSLGMSVQNRGVELRGGCKEYIGIGAPSNTIKHYWTEEDIIWAQIIILSTWTIGAAKSDQRGIIK